MSPRGIPNLSARRLRFSNSTASASAGSTTASGGAGWSVVVDDVFGASSGRFGAVADSVDAAAATGAGAAGLESCFAGLGSQFNHPIVTYAFVDGVSQSYSSSGGAKSPRSSSGAVGLLESLSVNRAISSSFFPDTGRLRDDKRSFSSVTFSFE